MSATATRYELIDVEALRVGMMVHLEGGWMSHPFPLSRFRIASNAQIATIRSLGLKHVRWDPAHSDTPDTSAPAETPAASPQASAAAPQDTPAEPAPTPEQRATAAHRAALAEQRAALRLCEQQFAEAADACHELTGKVPTQPREACVQAQELARTLLDKMLASHEPCIQLLTSTAGDKATAHALNVTVISLLMGKRLGLDESQMLDLGVGAMLHDIGKLDVHESVRHCDDGFDAADRKAYEEHVALGVLQARRMGMNAGAMLVVAQHHECADATGFPLRLALDKMSVASRVVSLVNRYDNLCNPRLAAKALTPHEALAMLFAAHASKFDQVILQAFIKLMGVYPPGSTVQLSDERYALVTAINSTRPLKPRVLVHEAGASRDDVLVLNLESRPELGIRRSVKPHQLPSAAMEFLAPAKRLVYFFEPPRLPARAS